jgi:hypothetical protein
VHNAPHRIALVFRSLKYTQTLIADRGVQPEAYTAFRFKSEVLYLETDTERYIM